ncbi:hypothetical protein SAMN02746041_01084 [Desulfacinum hydrothermale DSM 13146]|uniref:Uncharacterized protein n=1 Tax=Desulfacinum hydrothermale DSM 13146 TaxID=1121390 RepID=A0A1W1XB57_9BACT|nr:hypothetical protein [Desulfacinum hydrothermale]SMC21004.1 hypothetical protein SAMN02746041_01084 [Desulfacinum hydrothermale DSM 13146]
MLRIKLICVLSVFLSLAIIALIPHNALTAFVLPLCWWAFFRPIDAMEKAMFVVASLFIIGQNYMVLKSGAFAFKSPDFFGMPYYEPLMWGFYALNIKRFADGRTSNRAGELRKALICFVLTGIAFSFFSADARLLTVASTATTALLLLCFHERKDLVYASYSLLLGLTVELFGVFTGRWWYPQPVILGLPLWFATMWLSVGILTRRFLIPVSWLAVQHFGSKNTSRPFVF